MADTPYDFMRVTVYGTAPNDPAEHAVIVAEMPLNDVEDFLESNNCFAGRILRGRSEVFTRADVDVVVGGALR